MEGIFHWGCALVARFWLVFVLVVVAYVYSGILHADYVWDDNALFVNSPLLRGVNSFEDFVRGVTQPILPGTTYFRPFVMTTFVVEFLDGGTRPSISHAVNLGLHLANTALVWLLVRQISAKLSEAPASQLTPLLAAAAYGLNPALHEAVCWVAGRFDLLATTFVVAMLVLQLRCDRKVWALLPVCLLYALALSSKEVAVVAPGILFLLLFSLEEGRPVVRVKRVILDRWAVWMSLVVVFAIYIVLRLHFMGSVVHEATYVLSHVGSFEKRAELVGRTAFFYAGMLLFPFAAMSPQHPHALSTLGPSDLIGAVLLVILTMFLLWRIWSSSHRMCAAALLSVGLALAPVINAVPLTIGDNIGHERFLTLPLVFFSFALALMGARLLQKWRLPAVLGICTWFAVAIANLSVTIPLWKNDLTLWGWAFSQHPEDGYVQQSLVTAGIKWGRLDLARKALEGARKHPDMVDSNEMLEGQLLVREHRYEEGVAKLQNALARYRLPHTVVQEKGLSLEGASFSGSGSEKFWFFPFSYAALCEGYLSLRRFEDAHQAALVALFYQPSYPPSNLLLALSLYGLGRQVEADAAYERALTLYVPSAKTEVEALRREFIAQLGSSAR